MKQFETYKRFIKKRLSAERYNHSINVAKEAGRLAEKWDCSVEKAWIAGLLHDIARDISPGVLLQKAKENNLITNEVELWEPVLLHGPVGAHIVREELGIDEAVLLRAIANHTVGAPQMTLMDKILYLADMIEPARQYPGIEELRSLVLIDINEAMLWGFDSTLRHILQKEGFIHPRTVEARNYLLRNCRLNRKRFIQGGKI